MLRVFALSVYTKNGGKVTIAWYTSTSACLFCLFCFLSLFCLVFYSVYVLRLYSVKWIENY